MLEVGEVDVHVVKTLVPRVGLAGRLRRVRRVQGYLLGRGTPASSTGEALEAAEAAETAVKSSTCSEVPERSSRFGTIAGKPALAWLA